MINELAMWKSFGFGIGVQSVYMFTKHSGIESGLYYKINPKNYFTTDAQGNFVNIIAREKTILFPVLYRFESALINFTAGMAIDYLLNQKDFKSNTSFPSVKWKGRNSEFISTISISKNFYLKKSLIVEPEIRASSFVPAGGGGVALNLSLRKKIF